MFFSFQTPLHLAIKQKNLSIIRLLLQGSASCNVPDINGNNALHLAIEMENVEILESICTESLVSIDITAVNCDGMSIMDLTRAKNLSENYKKLMLSSQQTDRNNLDCCNNELETNRLRSDFGVRNAPIFSSHWHSLHQPNSTLISLTPTGALLSESYAAPAPLVGGDLVEIRQSDNLATNVKEVSFSYSSSLSSSPSPQLESPLPSPSVAPLPASSSPFRLNFLPQSPVLSSSSSSSLPYRAPSGLSRLCERSSSSSSSSSLSPLPSLNFSSYVDTNNNVMSLNVAC